MDPLGQTGWAEGSLYLFSKLLVFKIISAELHIKTFMTGSMPGLGNSYF